MKDIEDIIEDELLEDQEETQSKRIEDNTPKTSTSYKDRLVRVYEELNNLDKNNLEDEIKKIQKELKLVISLLEDSERKIEQITTNKIDKEMEQDRDLHYLPKTKSNMSKEASDGYFSTKNMIIYGLSALSLLLIITILAIVLL